MPGQDAVVVYILLPSFIATLPLWSYRRSLALQIILKQHPRGKLHTTGSNTPSLHVSEEP